ncbi:MAG: hypothetical protein GX247_05150, partial [Mollicutes bacterium]|nr:hypothetical protein [Mollicutes bacterium]
EMPSLSVIRGHGDTIIFDSSYVSSIKVNYSDNLSGIVVAKYARGIKDKTYFASNGKSISNNGIISNVKVNEEYTVYVKDSAGNEEIISIHSNIFDDGQTAKIDNLEISVSNTYWSIINWLPGHYRDLTTKVKSGSGVTINGYAHSSGRSYLSSLNINSITSTIKIEKELYRNYASYHTVFISDSEGKIYKIWIRFF